MRKKPARGPRGRSEWGAVQALDAKVNRFFKNLEPRPSPVLTPGTVSRPRVNLVTRMKNIIDYTNTIENHIPVSTLTHATT